MALTDSLVAYYSLDDATDELGSYNLTNNNSAAFSASGIIGNALTLGSANTNKSLSWTTNEMGMTAFSNFTAAFWFYVETAPTSGQFATIFARNFNGDSSNGCQIRCGYENAGGTLRLRFFRLGSTNVFLDRTGTLSLNTWYQGAFTYDGSTIRAYYNGTEYANNSNTGTQTISGSRFTIGTNTVGANDPFKGNIDEFGLWDRTLDASEISQLYNGGAGLAYPFGTGFTATPLMHMLHMAAGTV